MIEGIRLAWKIFSFSDVKSSSSSSTSSATPDRSPSASFQRRRRHRRVPLHRACSLPLPGNSGGRVTRPGAYQIVRTRGAARQHRVAIPQGVEPGTEFTTIVAGFERVVTCPPTSRPGNFVRISVPGHAQSKQFFLKMAPLTRLPVPLLQQNMDTIGSTKQRANAKNNKIKSETNLVKIKVKVPVDVQPGTIFLAKSKHDGKQYSVTCPAKIPRNRKLKFMVPATRVEEDREATDLDTSHSNSCVACMNAAAGSLEAKKQGDTNAVYLRYDETLAHGWMRQVCSEHSCPLSQWVYKPKDEQMDDSAITVKDHQEDGSLESSSHLAFCRSMTTLPGRDKRLQTGILSFVPPSQAGPKSSLPNNANDADRDLTDIQALPLDEKTEWFRTTCQNLGGLWEDGNIKVVVRRDFLLEDSVKAVMSLSPANLRQPWRLEFVGEPAIDSGGVTREWFELVSEELNDPEQSLFITTNVANQMCVDINPDSGKDQCKQTGMEITQNLSLPSSRTTSYFYPPFLSCSFYCWRPLGSLSLRWTSPGTRLV